MNRKGRKWEGTLREDRGREGVGQAQGIRTCVTSWRSQIHVASLDAMNCYEHIYDSTETIWVSVVSYVRTTTQAGLAFDDDYYAGNILANTSPKKACFISPLPSLPPLPPPVQPVMAVQPLSCAMRNFSNDTDLRRKPLRFSPSKWQLIFQAPSKSRAA